MEEVGLFISITCFFRFLPDLDSSFPRITSPIAFWAILKAPLLSSSFLLITIHACIPALDCPKTGRPNMCAAALVVLHPLKVLSQNVQVAFLAPPSFAFDEFVTEKY